LIGRGNDLLFSGYDHGMVRQFCLPLGDSVFLRLLTLSFMQCLRINRFVVVPSPILSLKWG
jgi:hypothetical protein